MSISEAPQPDIFSGITAPTRRGGSSRHLTDVVVELGFADRETVDRALEAARHRPDLGRPEVAGVAEAMGDAAELAGRYEQARSGYARSRRWLGPGRRAPGSAASPP